MAEPLVVLVGGPPASGKTTLAERIAREFGLPLIAKDGLKETLFDAIADDVDLRRSEMLGRAAFALVWHVLERQLAAGGSAVVEGNFDTVRSPAEIARLRERHPFSLVQVHCRAPVDVLERRYAERAPDRHPGHLDTERRPRFEADAYLPDPADAELVVVDTASPGDGAYTEIARLLARRFATGVDSAAPQPVSALSAPNWAATRFGLTPDRLDMRILRGVLGCEHVGVGYLRFGGDWRPTVGHRHPAGEEVYVLVEGRARMKVDDAIHELEAPAAIRVAGRQLRGIRAAGGAPAVFVVAGWPIDDPDATEIVEGFWPASG